jgi:succinylglutamic semialdehyde dehydrogenase
MSGKLYINGAWIEGGGAGFTSENPATGEIIWRGKAADAADIDAAMQAARAAFKQWGFKPVEPQGIFCGD